MTSETGTDMIRQLEAEFKTLELHRPMRISHYDTGLDLEYVLTPIEPGPCATLRLHIEKFVGGGFAGQVYKVRLNEILIEEQSFEYFQNLSINEVYALKILIPPSEASCLFRNFLYAVGFQGPFQLQVNPAASRAGALWQTFIRAAAAEHFKDEQCVNHVHGTLIDHTLGSCGELSSWVEGRTWRLEVDDHLDHLKRWKKRKPMDVSMLSSPEYRAKHTFMHEFVKLLHEMGAPEFARQYEWSTCKSQPNCLKRLDTNEDSQSGLIAVDFRAGLTLLPFLPMSPGDFKLIGKGLMRGSLVQFDRGCIKTLEQYIADHPQAFAQIPQKEIILRELKECEDLYRNSLPDITHNGPRLFYDSWLWSTIFSSAVTGWKVRNLIDESHENRLRTSRIKTFLFFLLGLIPLLGRTFRKAWGRPDWQAHYKALFTSGSYFRKAVKGKILEKLIDWIRAERVTKTRAQKMSKKPFGFFLHLPLSILPAGLHRFLTDPSILKSKLYFLFVRPFKLYFNAGLREQWMRDMLAQGQKKHIISDEDAQTIQSQLNEPYIQKYLVSLVVHVMTLPVTQIVSVIVAAIFYWTHPDMPQAERTAAVAGILVLFQVIPISPGSFCRGFYTTIVAFRDRNFNDYNIALFLSYFKYVGYLAFPIQMTYKYPAMARFMAAHWATDAVHIVPVFGERGALLEHWIFCLFYNWPLTIRRRMGRISELRNQLPTRYWHIPLMELLAAGALALSHGMYLFHTENIVPNSDNFWLLKPLWCLTLLIPLITGWAVTKFAAGLSRSKRIISASICGACTGILYTLAAGIIESQLGLEEAPWLVPMIWRSFAFTIFCTIGAILTEIKTADPDLKNLTNPDYQP